MEIPARPGLNLDLAIVRGATKRWLLTITYSGVDDPVNISAQQPTALFKESDEDADEDAKITVLLSASDDDDPTKAVLEIIDSQTGDLLDGKPLPGGLLILPYGIKLLGLSDEVVWGNLHVFEWRVKQVV